MYIFSIIGARPQFIKAAPLSRAIRVRHTEFLVHTGQHYNDDMSSIFFRELNIPEPDKNLGIGSASHGKQTANMVIMLEELMQEYRPDIVLVYGDTNSTLAGALTASKLNIPIAHVEAGLRSYNRAMPEEINRVLTDHVSRWLFCPSIVAKDNLAKEGIEEGVSVTGDIMVDAVLSSVERANSISNIHELIGVAPYNYALATIHRPVNADNPKNLLNILTALAKVGNPVVFPVHPRTKVQIEQLNWKPPSNLHLIQPLGYLDLLALLGSANFVITDSGGLQKEAYIMKRPCITVRSETEWVETVQEGWNRLVDPTIDSILSGIESAKEFLPVKHSNIYGNGQAAMRILQELENI